MFNPRSGGTGPGYICAGYTLPSGEKFSAAAARVKHCRSRWTDPCKTWRESGNRTPPLRGLNMGLQIC